MHKKGITSDTKTYRPIRLLHITYKVFLNILLQRMICTLTSTINHVSKPHLGQEKANEYQILLCFAFIDYEKAFDSMEFEPLFEELKNQSVDKAYLNNLQNIYSEATSVLRFHKDSEN